MGDRLGVGEFYQTGFMDGTEILGVAEVPRAVEMEMRRGYQVQQKMAVARQERINADSRRFTNRMSDNIGERYARVDPMIFFHFARIYGAECWNDPDFMDHCMKNGLVQRERSRSDKTTLRMPGRNARVGTSRIVSANRFGGVAA